MITGTIITAANPNTTIIATVASLLSVFLSAKRVKIHQDVEDNKKIMRKPQTTNPNKYK
jgi:hypothetical protein